MARESASHESHRERSEYNEERALHSFLLCQNEEMWKQVCDALYCEASNVLVELYNLMPRRNADFIKAKGGATKY